MPRGLSDDFVDRVGPFVSQLSLVHTETLHIVETASADGTVVDSPRSGYVIPVQGIAVDAEAHAPLLPDEVAATLAGLSPDEVILSESSAEFRRLDIGGTISFEDGRTVTVAAIASDPEFGAEELITTNTELVGGDGSELRFAVVEFDGTTDELDALLADALPEGAGYGVHPRGRPEDQTTAVRSQIFIKQTFGEFAYRPSGGGSFAIDPAWVEENIITRQIPLLGTVRCHRFFVDVLEQVMTALEAAGHTDVIDRSGYRGCYTPRYVANSQRLSRHAWGAAADINFFNPLDGGPGSPVHAALLETMAAFGVTSGHDWSIPDPGHFEYYGFPEGFPEDEG